MVNPEGLPTNQGNEKYGDMFSRCRFSREEKKTLHVDNNERKSPSDVYRFNVEGIKPKQEDGKIEDNILLQLFKDQDMASGQLGGVTENKLEPQLPSQNSHAHPYKPESSSWPGMNYHSKTESYSLPQSTSFGGSGEAMKNILILTNLKPQLTAISEGQTSPLPTTRSLGSSWNPTEVIHLPPAVQTPALHIARPVHMRQTAELRRRRETLFGWAKMKRLLRRLE